MASLAAGETDWSFVLLRSCRASTRTMASDVAAHIQNMSNEGGAGSAKRGTEAEDTDTESKDVDGPDTSSFTAFLVSLLSSAEPSGHSNEEPDDSNVKTEGSVSSSGTNERAGRKGLIARGKHSLGRVLTKASRITGYRDKKLEKKDEHDLTNVPNPSLNESIPMNISENTASRIELPAISESSLLLSENMRSGLYVSLPAVTQGKNWVLLYRAVIRQLATLTIVGDQMGAVFGGLVEVPLHPTNKRKYQGTNNTFVFTILSGHPVIYRPTGANRYFTLCSTEYLALGGGGHFALYLDGDLLTGSSSTSETFDNPCLAHSQDFEVKEVELWGFVYASNYEEMMALCRTEAPGICRW
ncbi:hypothetical protein Taro_002887 [Colocasia esculenta]|uniref:Oxidation resistance protein 1 n=1 Tax=Colocasia esculenta TaxID=4460 RepID=A0A843THS3_COLES|nr:hypothetical protein [Colocasia esculenta]